MITLIFQFPHTLRGDGTGFNSLKLSVRNLAQNLLKLSNPGQ